MILNILIWVLIVWNVIKVLVNAYYWVNGSGQERKIALFQAIEATILFAVLWHV